MADSSLIMVAQFSQSVPAYLLAKCTVSQGDIPCKNDLCAGNWLQCCNLAVVNTEKKVISDFVMSFGVLIPLVYRISTTGIGEVYFLFAVAILFFNGGNF